MTLFRAHPLDGSMLYFHPETGTQVRVRGKNTRALERTAPRVVMFGITNACNLRCEFCSRDTSRESSWTVASAAEVLEGLAAAGTLEVAFGGGEPFAFRGFAELLLRLRKTTRLALHVTTNGTLVDAGQLVLTEGILGMVRVSIYDDVPWRPAAQALFRAEQRWGANVLVTDRSLSALPALALELAALGARDVSLLSYVGPDPSMTLSRTGEEALAAFIAVSPLPCRVSVCFGTRLGVSRLWNGTDDGGDCGAGLDFLSITPDKRVQSCSFQEGSFPIASAGDALAVWRSRRDELREASPRPGCARTRPTSSSVPRDGVHVWQSFSGNNSGECILVSKFDSAEDAEKLLADLLPGFVPGEPYGAPWKELLVAERVSLHDGSFGTAPDEMIAVGRTFVARTDYAAGDDFPELRALTWKRGGQVICGGIHVHDGTPLLAVIRARDPKDAAALVSQSTVGGAVACAHGRDVIVAISSSAPNDSAGGELSTVLAHRRDALTALAGDRPFAMETAFDAIDERALVAVMKKLGTTPDEAPRLLLSFWRSDSKHRKQEESAQAFAKNLEGTVSQVKNLVLVEDLVRRKRTAIEAHRQGAWVSPLDGAIVEVWAELWREEPRPTRGKAATPAEPLVAAEVETDLRARLRLALGAAPFELTKCIPGTWGGRVQVRVRTSSPALVLAALAADAKSRGAMISLGVLDVDKLERAVRRLLQDVHAAAVDLR